MRLFPPRRSIVYRPTVTARDEILQVARLLATRSADGSFGVQEVVDEVRRQGIPYKESTIRTHVTSRMCANAPDHHPVTYSDFVRVDVGRYRFA